MHLGATATRSPHRGDRPAGPVVVSLPLDVLQATGAAAPGPVVRFHSPAPAPAGIAEAGACWPPRSAPRSSSAAGRATRKRTSRSLKPPLRRAATTWLRKNAIPNTHPAFVGCLGYGAHEVSDQLVRDADVIVALGCRFSEFTTKRWTLVPPAADLVHVLDIDPAELGRVHPPRVGLGLRCHCRVAGAHVRARPAGRR